MKIDLHTHSETGSACGNQGVDQIACGAIASGLDAVCLTDHNNLAARAEAAEVAARLNFPIFHGMEVSTEEGDIIAFGPLRENGYGLLSYAEWRAIIDRRAFALIPAHPFRGGGGFGQMPEMIRCYPDDFAALEAYSVNMTVEDSEKTVELAGELGLPVVANSDSHAPNRPPGSNYNILNQEVHSVQELVEALNAGAFEAMPVMDPIRA